MRSRYIYVNMSIAISRAYFCLNDNNGIFITAERTSVPCQIRAKHMYELPIKAGPLFVQLLIRLERFAL